MGFGGLARAATGPRGGRKRKPTGDWAEKLAVLLLLFFVHFCLLSFCLFLFRFPLCIITTMNVSVAVTDARLEHGRGVVAHSLFSCFRFLSCLALHCVFGSQWRVAGRAEDYV